MLRSIVCITRDSIVGVSDKEEIHLLKKSQRILKKVESNIFRLSQ